VTAVTVEQIEQHRPRAALCQQLQQSIAVGILRVDVGAVTLRQGSRRPASCPRTAAACGRDGHER